MMRIFAWIAASVSLASAQVPPEKESGGKPVPVEASAAIRESLAASKKPRLREVLPDPTKYPKLHAEEAEQARQHFALREIATYPCYDVNSGYDLQPLLDTFSASASLQPTASGERFWPEKLVFWGKGDGARWVAWSDKTREVVFIEGDKQLRYSLTPEAVKHLRSTMGDMRALRPDAMEEAVPLLDALKRSEKITIHEGVPRRDPGEAALKRRGEWLIDGFQFLKNGALDHDTEALRNLLLKEGSLVVWRGTKACGGFHPDFAITWKVADRDVSLLICFGCHEAMFVDPAVSLLYDLPDESYKVLKAELEKFRPQPVEVPRGK